jgi:hypothetical protein
LETREVACQNIGDGVYIECNDLDFQEVIAKPMSYDYGKEIEVVVQSNTAATSTNINFSNPFQNLFGSVATTLIMWLIIGISLIAAIIISVLLFKCFCRHCLFFGAQFSAGGASSQAPAESA